MLHHFQNACTFISDGTETDFWFSDLLLYSTLHMLPTTCNYHTSCEESASSQKTSSWRQDHETLNSWCLSDTQDGPKAKALDISWVTKYKQSYKGVSAGFPSFVVFIKNTFLSLGQHREEKHHVVKAARNPPASASQLLGLHASTAWSLWLPQIMLSPSHQVLKP